MNAITFPRVPLPEPAGDAAYTAVCATFADAHLGTAMDRLADATGALYERRCTLSPQEATARDAMRDALIAMAHARNLIAPLMVERAQ
jgi:hypothetical protein